MTPDVSVHDIVTLAAKGKLSVCFPYKGQLGLFENGDRATPDHNEIAKSIFVRALKTVYFNGILRSLSWPLPDNEINNLQNQTHRTHTLHPVRVVPICVFASDKPNELVESESHHWRRVHGSKHSWAGTHFITKIPSTEWMIEFESLHELAKPFAIQRQQENSNITETPKKEHPKLRQDRRLKRFRELGGSMTPAGTGWHTKGDRGILATLVKEEKASGNPMSDRSDVRQDLIKATERWKAEGISSI